MPTSSGQRYCSLACNRDWNLANPRLIPKACSVCKGIKPVDEFGWINTKGIRRSDCKECVSERGKKQHKEHREQHPEMYSKRRRYDGYKDVARVCEWCNEEYYAKNHGQRFCGRNCSGAANIDRSEAICKQCGKDFKKTGNAHEYCSLDCSKEWNLSLDLSGTEKVCRGCNELKPITAFIQRPKTGYFESHCVVCMNKARDARAEADPVKAKRNEQKNRLRRDFGLTLAQYDYMLAAQGGVCAICKQKCTRHSVLSVDHCHTTGVVRGLLCASCNFAIGFLGDDPAIMRNAADYVEIHHEVFHEIFKGGLEPCPLHLKSQAGSKKQQDTK
jgi:hypothetical protein